MSGNIIDFQDYRDSKTTAFPASVLCIPCNFRWIGAVQPDTNIFHIDCPNCGARETYAAILPESYTEAVLKYMREKSESDER